MGMVQVDAVITTGERTPTAYGIVQLEEPLLQQIAAAVRDGSMPLWMNHGVRDRWRARVIDSGVRTRADGVREVWACLEVDEADWERWQSMLRGTGAPGGMSFSMSTPQGWLDAESASAPLRFDLAADAFHWDDDVRLDAGSALRAAGDVEIGQRYSFALEPPAIVSLTVAWKDVFEPILLSIAASCIFEGLRRFMKPDKPTTFHFKVERRDQSVHGHLETDDQEVLRRAIEALEQIAISPSSILEWDEAQEAWRPAEERGGQGGSDE